MALDGVPALPGQGTGLRDGPRLLLLAHSVPPAGAGQVLAALLQGLPAKGWAVSLGLLTLDESPSPPWVTEAAVPVVRLGPARGWKRRVPVVRASLGLMRLIRHERPAIVNVQYPGSCLSVRDLLGIRLAGVRWICASIQTFAPATLPARWSNRIGALFCRVVIVPSEGAAGLLAHSGIPRRKIRVVYCGVGVPAPVLTRAEARRRLGIDARAFVVCSVARLVPDKGIPELAQAARLLPGDNVLLVAGEGPGRAALEAAGSESTGLSVRLTGWIDGGLSGIYAAADVLALPSHREAFSLVYQEAAMHGLPLIGCDIPGTRESIVDGETGILVPVRDPDALAAAITLLKDDEPLRRRLGEAARARALAHFTETAMVDAYDEVLRGRG